MYLTEKVLDYINPNFTVLCLGFNKQFVDMLRREGFFNQIDIFGADPYERAGGNNWLKVKYIDTLPVDNDSYDLVVYFYDHLKEYKEYLKSTQYAYNLAKTKMIMVAEELPNKLERMDCYQMLQMDRSAYGYKIMIFYKKNNNSAKAVDPYADGKKH